MAEWTIALVCKTNARKGYVGSNPTPSTNKLALVEGSIMQPKKCIANPTPSTRKTSVLNLFVQFFAWVAQW